MRSIVPMSELPRRLPESGRIRFGEKGPKGEPRKLTEFRFTSHNGDAIDQIAGLYGGTPSAWTEMPGQWQVKTEAATISIVLPPDPLGGTPIYELWAGGGVLRRCDGEICLVPVKSVDGAEMVECPCTCAANGKLECKPKTRLSVLLPGIDFTGSWRIESGGWNVAHELPGMVDMIQSLQARGLTRAYLALEPRTTKFAGQTRRFVVPVLRPSVSLDALAAGEGQVLALGTARIVSDVSEVDHEGPGSFDDQVIEAEIVGEGAPGQAGEPAGAERGQSAESPSSPATTRRMHAILNEIGMGVTERHALVLASSHGRISSSAELTEKEIVVMIKVLLAIKRGEAEYLGKDNHGWAIVRRRG